MSIDQKLSACYLSDIRRYAQTSVRFNLDLGFAKNGLNLEPKEIQRICKTSLTWLLRKSECTYIYGQQNTATFERFSTNVEKKPGKYQIIKDKDVVSGFEDYWSAYCNERGTVLFEMNLDDDALCELFEMTQNPSFLENLGSVASKSAIRYARKATENSFQRICILITYSQGLNMIAVFAHPKRIGACLNIAFEKCQYTERFLNMYGV